MAPSRKQRNGRSPLVNPQRQITAFFSKTTTASPSPSPTPTLSRKHIPISDSNPNPNPNHKPGSESLSPSSSPTTPSPLQSKPRKPLLVIGQTPTPPPSTTAVYGKEVVEKRIKVYWPLDKSWYEGCVKSYDEDSKRHLVLYDDFEEELLDLSKEKIEWVEQTVKKFKRLLRGSLGFRKMVLEDEEMENVEEYNGGGDSSDEDWENNVVKEVSEEEDMDLEDEVEEDDNDMKGKRGGKSGSKKRKASGGGTKQDSGKKGKTAGDTITEGLKVSVVEPVKNKEDGVANGIDNATMVDPSEGLACVKLRSCHFLERMQREGVLEV